MAYLFGNQDTFGYGGAPGQYLYGGNDQIANLSRQQAGQSMAFGDVAADYADPVHAQRGQYQDMLKYLLTNPIGALSSDPTLKFLQDQGANAVNARNAATGNLLSGGGQVALQDRAQGIAASYIPQLAGMYGQFGGFNTSNPGAAGRSYAEFAARSQNQNQQSVAQRNAPSTGLPTGGAGPAFGSAEWQRQTYPGMNGPSDPYNPTTNPTGYYASPTQQVSGGGGYSQSGGYSPQSAPSTYQFGNVTQFNPNDAATNNDWANMAGPDYGGYDWNSYDPGSMDFGGGY